MAQRELRAGDEFFESGDRDVNRPLRVVGPVRSTPMLTVEQTERRGGPSGRARGWTTRRGKVLVMRIGTGKRFAFPPGILPRTIFFKS